MNKYIRALLASLGFARKENGQQLRLQVKERDLGWMHAGGMLDTLVGSPDGRHVAYAVRTHGKWSLVVDGTKAEQAYDLPLPHPFVDLPSHEQEEFFVKMEGDEDFHTQLSMALRPIFSPDSQRVAYVGCRFASQQAFRHLGLAPPVKQMLVVDGVEGDEYEWIVQGSVVFSPDSHRIAYAADRDSGLRVVVDGVEETAYKSIYNPTFSPDSKHVGYVAGMVGNRQAIVDNTVVSRNYSDVGGGTGVVFSPDSRRIAYAVVQKDKEFMVIDGKEQSAYHQVGWFSFSFDNRRNIYTAWRDGLTFFVIDGVYGKAYSAAGHITPPFSPDSQHVVYLALRDGKQCVVLDGEEQKTYDEIGGVYFSPDSRHLAYSARVGDRWCMVMDGEEGNRYAGITGITFGPNQHLAYFARIGDRCVIVVDGVETSTEYSMPVPAPRLVFDSRHVLHTLAYWFSEQRVQLFFVELSIG